MVGRNKIPKYNINKNVLVIGGSGSGKTRFVPDIGDQCLIVQRLGLGPEIFPALAVLTLGVYTY